MRNCLSPQHDLQDFQLVSLKLLASELLLACPGYNTQYKASYYEDPGADRKQEKTLFSDIHVPGEITEATFKLTGVRLYASPNNPGAHEVAQVFQKAITGLELSADSPLVVSAHFLLYLAHETFVGEAGERLAEEVRAMVRANQAIVMVHENDMANGGCEFARMFSTTPQDLIADGLYKALALAYYPGLFRPVSIALVAKRLGAVSGLRSWQSSWSSSKALHMETAKMTVQASKASSTKASSTMDGTMDMSRDSSAASKSDVDMEAPWEGGVAAASVSTGGEQKPAQDEPSAFQSAQRWEAAAAKEFEAGMGEEHGV